MPFTFPDPTVQSSIVHPVTGETWVYTDGTWVVEDSSPDGTSPATVGSVSSFSLIEDEVEQNEEQLQALSTLLLRLVGKVDDLEDLNIQNALSALAAAKQDIIDLKSKVNTLELTSFLILE